MDKRSQWIALHPDHAGLLMRWEANDVISDIAQMIGPKGYTDWAVGMSEQRPADAPWHWFQDMLEAKLLELHGVHTRQWDRETYERLDEEFQASKSEARFAAVLEAAGV